MSHRNCSNLKSKHPIGHVDSDGQDDDNFAAMGRRFFARVRRFKMRAMRRLGADAITRALRPPAEQASAVRAAVARRVLRGRPRSITTFLTQVKPLQGLLPMDLRWANGFTRASQDEGKSKDANGAAVGSHDNSRDEETELRAAVQAGNMAGPSTGDRSERLWRDRQA